MRKTVLVCAVFAALCAGLVSCRKKAESAAGAKTPVVSTVCRSSYATSQWFKDMNAAFTAETGIAVDVQPTPGNDDDHMAKVNVDLLAGGTIDVIETLGPRDQQGRIENGFFMPLEAALREAGVDYEAIWGKYLDYQSDGQFYGVPYKQEIGCVFYNKDMFDRAGVPYPAGPWTWEDYLETARKLTNPSKGEYGSFFGDDCPWYFYTAKQQGVPFYKADGTSNFDDPRFAASLQWYYDLSHKEKVNMTVAQLKADNVSWNYYAMAGDHLAMYPNMNWFTRLLNSQSDYPRAWRYGVAPTPAAKDGGNKVFVSMCYVSINKNAAHPKEAAVYLAWLGQNQWKYEGGLPALASLSPEDQNRAFETTAAESGGQITVEELYSSMINNGMGIEQSDIVGPAATEYNQIIKEEAERFNMDQQDLATTVSRVIARANEAIENAQ